MNILLTSLGDELIYQNQFCYGRTELFCAMVESERHSGYFDLVVCPLSWKEGFLRDHGNRPYDIVQEGGFYAGNLSPPELKKEFAVVGRSIHSRRYRFDPAKRSYLPGVAT